MYIPSAREGQCVDVLAGCDDNSLDLLYRLDIFVSLIFKDVLEPEHTDDCPLRMTHVAFPLMT
jgi:hypothetical protein